MIAKEFMRGLQTVVFVFAASCTVHSQDAQPVAPGQVMGSLSASQKSLMEGSKKAILKTGMSEPYFNKHFRIVEVIDKPGDRRVVWKFLINGYEATINDAIGYYTEAGKRIDVHSVENVLMSTSNINRTISRARAHRILRACLGKFTGPAVEYRAGSSGRAELLLTASSVPRSRRSSERERKRKEEEAREREAKPDRQVETDVIEEEEDHDRPPIYIASVNLETGKCIKGLAKAGPRKVQ